MFISFEGIEGAGKSTVLQAVSQKLQADGKKVLCTREPGGCALGQALRAILLNTKTALFERAELFLFLADRAQHLQEVVRPALAAGQIVLCDRYVDSTLAYQGYARGLDLEMLRYLNQLATESLKPDLTFLLNLDVQIGLMRAAERNNKEGTNFSEGRFDSERLEFHEKVRQGYLALAHIEQERFIIIDAKQNVEQVVAECLQTINQTQVARKCP